MGFFSKIFSSSKVNKLSHLNKREQQDAIRRNNGADNDLTHHDQVSKQRALHPEKHPSGTEVSRRY